MAITAIIVGAAAVAGTTVYASNQQEKQVNKQVAQAEQQRAKAEEVMRQNNSAESQSAVKAKQNQARKQALAAYGKSDTLLTGPDGVVADSTGGLGGMGGMTKQAAPNTLLGG